jgi:hypothetical protein
MEKSFRKFKKVPLIISLIFLSVSILVFVILYQSTNKNDRLFEEAQARWEQEAEEKYEMESLENFIKMSQSDILALNNHFIKSSDVVPFLDTIEKLALKVGVDTKVTSVDIASDNNSLMVGLEARGTFERLYKLLTLLENSPYQLEFTTMSLKKDVVGESEEVSEASTWSAVFKIKLLSFIK